MFLITVFTDFTVSMNIPDSKLSSQVINGQQNKVMLIQLKQT